MRPGEPNTEAATLEHWQGRGQRHIERDSPLQNLLPLNLAGSYESPAVFRYADSSLKFLIFRIAHRCLPQTLALTHLTSSAASALDPGPFWMRFANPSGIEASLAHCKIRYGPILGDGIAQ
jgi:hypothetical protein